MNAFSNVDGSGRDQELIDYLDQVDHALRAPHGPKQRLRAGLTPTPGGRVLDLGCGAGHELVQLESDGMRAYGVDASAAMLAASRARLQSLGHPARLVRADAQRLPFAGGYFDGCRIERVLQHVADPAAVLAQAHRVLRPGAVIGILEPDWASLTLSSHDRETARAVADQAGRHIPHRDIGRHLRRLLAHSGFDQIHVEVELMVYNTVEELSRIISLEHITNQARDTGRVEPALATAFLNEQHTLSAARAFHATLHRSTLAWARRP
ncbi:methyltransferase domain-containing protein [Streptomyces sp. NBC_00347]|uniref:methyltransferase domain-containing protein n=1 Tax=Streptomyces sp. NBC_00347 TaxID=2975721 RepID=UPI00224D8E80|nr:methyltransferase domain-containing protein [Streptomyces sp. NBC_00347]MCX5129978.1 methyltransferase domain-containing protein [Streptomyces sp. NBC_00347]